MSVGDAAILTDAYLFCDHIRNRITLMRGTSTNALPTQADQLARLARSLDTTAAGLREEYRRVTRKAREVFERLFYAAG